MAVLMGDLQPLMGKLQPGVLPRQQQQQHKCIHP